jgi:hypothetical protein
LKHEGGRTLTTLAEKMLQGHNSMDSSSFFDFFIYILHLDLAVSLLLSSSTRDLDLFLDV